MLNHSPSLLYQLAKTRILVLSILLTIAFSVSAQVETHPYTCYGKHQSVAKRVATSFEQKLIDDSNARSDTFDIQHYEIHIDITDYFGQTIDAHTTLSISARMDGQDDIRLDLKDLDITQVQVDGIPATFTHIGEVLEVDLGMTVNEGEVFYVDVWYNGHPYQDPQWGGFYFEANYIYNLGIGLSTIPPNFGRVWYPCFDTFVERATYDWHVTSANGHVPHCQGEFISETALGGDTLTRHYALDIPIPTYLSAIAAADYVTISYDHEGAYGTIPVLLHAKAGQQTSMETRFTNLPAAIDALEYWFGPYIWNKVGYVMTTVGAMEHATNIAYPQSMMSQSNVSNEGLFSHELGHLWWGDIVSPIIHNHMWLKEGNAEYSQHLMREWLSGRDAFLNEVKDNHLFVLETAHSTDNGFFALSPIPDDIIYGRHTYYKGASVVHNIRGYMGDSLFKVGMQAVLDTFYLSYMGPDDFESVLSSSTGVDMSDFFQDQIYSPGFSAFEIDSIDSEDLGGGQWLNHLWVQQKLRECPTAYNNVPIDITFLDENWERHVTTVHFSGELDEADIITDFEPIMVMLNAEGRLNQARMDYEEVYTETTSTLSLPWADYRLKVEELNEGDSLFFRGEHYWVAPDNSLMDDDIVMLSNTHYYTVDGQWPEGSRLTGRFNYEGVFDTYLDWDLVNSGSESDIGLVFRASQSDPWSVYPYTTMSGVGGGNGSAKADSLKKGEYTFALLDPLVNLSMNETIEWSLFPNPAQEAFTITSDHLGLVILEIYDRSGRLCRSERLNLIPSEAQIISLKDLDTGAYNVRLISSEGDIMSSQSLIKTE